MPASVKDPITSIVTVEESGTEVNSTVKLLLTLVMVP